MADADPLPSPATRHALGDLVVDTRAQRVERDGVALKVSGLSFQLLAYLVAQGDRVVGFDELIEQVWAPAVVNEETVTQRVKLLRQALGDDGRDPRYLRSVRGRGYQLCVRPRALPDAEAVAQASPPAAAEPRVRTNARVRPWLAAAAAAVIASLIAFAGWHRLRPAPPAAPVATQTLTERAAFYASLGQRDNNERAIALYRQALRERPDDRPARLGLSRAFSARVCLFNFDPQWALRAQALAEAAIAAAPGDAAGYAALGYSHDCRGHLDQALAGYERALALDPAADATRASAAYLYDRKGRLADALIANTSLRGDPARVRFLSLQIANNLELLGYPQAAQTRYRDSFRLYPDNVYSNIAWPRFLFRQGRLSEAGQALRTAMQRGTEHADLHVLAGELALVEGDRARAAAAFARAAALRPQASLPRTLADLYPVSPERAIAPAQARARAGELSRTLRQGAGYPGDWLEPAMLHLAAGDRAAALADVRRAVADGYSDAAYLTASPLLRPLAADPAFAHTLDRIHQRIGHERGRIPPALLARLTAAP